MPLATARKVELSEDWVQRYEAHNPAKREVLTVATTVADSPAADFFRSGDILLSIDGELASTFRQVERASQQPTVEVTVSRDGREVTGRVGTVALDGLGIERVVSWAGALLQAPHRELAVQRGVGSGGVYVSFFNFGSPASRSGLFAGRRIVAVDGEPTPDLEAFVRVDGEPRQQGVGAAQHDVVQRRARSHHDEARPAVLAELRARPRRLRVAAAGVELSRGSRGATEVWLQERGRPVPVRVRDGVPDVEPDAVQLRRVGARAVEPRRAQ